MKIKNLLEFFVGVNIWKSVACNFRLFSFNQALKMPIWIYHHTRINFKNNNVRILGSIHPGMIKIGIPLSHLIDCKENTLVVSEGVIEFGGNCVIGRGSKIAVSKDCILKFGKGFNATGNLHICCEKGISISDDCMFSWNVTLLDTDYHPIFRDDGRLINESRPIEIGNHVWLGCECIILKGVKIADNCVIAAGSVVRHSLPYSNMVYGMSVNSIQKLRENIQWSKSVL